MVAEHDKDMALLSELRGSSADDRTLAIIHAAYIEKYLRRLLEHAFIGADTKLRGKLLDPNGALGPVAARIDVCLALNLITKELSANAIQVVRTRNRFAHNLDVRSFDQPGVSEIVDKLTLRPIAYGNANAPKDDFTASIDAMYKSWSRRQKFDFSAIAVCVGLRDAAAWIDASHGHKD